MLLLYTYESNDKSSHLKDNFNRISGKIAFTLIFFWRYIFHKYRIFYDDIENIFIIFQ